MTDGCICHTNPMQPNPVQIFDILILKANALLMLHAWSLWRIVLNSLCSLLGSMEVSGGKKITRLNKQFFFKFFWCLFGPMSDRLWSFLFRDSVTKSLPSETWYGSTEELSQIERLQHFATGTMHKESM